MPPRYAVHLQEQVNQPEKSLTARVIGPPPALAFPLFFCRHKAGVPRGSCQPQRPPHKPRLWFSRRDSPCSALQWGEGSSEPDYAFLFVPLSSPICPPFPDFALLLERSRVDEWGLPCARDVILTLSAPKKSILLLSLCEECL